LTVDIVARRIRAASAWTRAATSRCWRRCTGGPAGAGNLNTLLQEMLTPHMEGQPERRYGGRVFRVGDKVTQPLAAATPPSPTAWRTPGRGGAVERCRGLC
jgi:exodeoxyribonuclease V alpha subunit